MDFSQIESALALATTAFGATDKAVSTVQAIKGLFNSEKPTDTSEASKLLNSLAAELTAANLMNVQLSESLRALAVEFKRVDEFETLKARYELYRTREDSLVFKLRADKAEGEPEHFVCPVCLNRDRLISYLQGTGDYKTCQTHRDHVFRFSNTPIRMPSRNDW